MPSRGVARRAAQHARRVTLCVQSDPLMCAVERHMTEVTALQKRRDAARRRKQRQRCTLARTHRLAAHACVRILRVRLRARERGRRGLGPVAARRGKGRGRSKTTPTPTPAPRTVTLPCDTVTPVDTRHNRDHSSATGGTAATPPCANRAGVRASLQPTQVPLPAPTHTHTYTYSLSLVYVCVWNSSRSLS